MIFHQSGHPDDNIDIITVARVDDEDNFLESRDWFCILLR